MYLALSEHPTLASGRVNAAQMIRTRYHRCLANPQPLADPRARTLLPRRTTLHRSQCLHSQPADSAASSLHHLLAAHW